MNNINNGISIGLNGLDKRMTITETVVQGTCCILKKLPRNKHFVTPVYKYCIDKVDPVFATAISLLAIDLIMHQLLPPSATCLASYVLSPILSDSIQSKMENECNISWIPLFSLISMTAAIPVMYIKYKQSFHTPNS